MLIKFNTDRKRFEATSSYAERLTANPTLKGAGFAFDGVNKLWHTAGYREPKPMQEQARIAAKLLLYCDGSAKTQLVSYLDDVVAVNAQALAVEAAKVTSLVSSRAIDSDAVVPVPDRIDPSTGKPMAYLPFQRAGIAYARGKQYVCIADEMGLGKTIQGIGISNDDPSIRSVLVVCPATPKINWRREWMKWCVKGLTVGVASPKFVPQTDVVIINFDVIKRHHAALIARTWDLLIIDESHKVKNPDAIRTQHILGKKATKRKDKNGKMVPVPPVPEIPNKRTAFLTGTPILNRPVELWSMLEKADPTGLGKSLFGYAKRYCDAKQTKFGWDFSGASNLDELQERLRSTFLVRRLKADVLKDLPAKRRQVILIEPDAAGKKLIEKEKVAYENLQMNEGDCVMLAEMSAARKAVAIYKASFVIEHVQDMLEDDGLKKVIVFAHHKDVVDQLMTAFGSAAVKVDGRVTKTEDRQAAVDRFTNDPTCKVFVGSIQAAGVAITLTVASTVVFAELDWVPANVTQAEDRAHRIGQTEQVLVQHVLLDESLDSNMVSKVIEKQAICDAALDTVKVKEPVALPPVGEPVKVEPKVVEVRTKAGVQQVVPLTPAQVAAVHQAMRLLRSRCDGAHEEDGKGFSGADVRFGWSLAAAPKLSPKQAIYGQRLVRKYQGQLGEEIVLAAGVELK